MKRIKLAGKLLRYAKVDDEDFAELSQYRWYLMRPTKNHNYAVRYSIEDDRAVAVLMHRGLMNTPKGMHTDHINHDGLDNQRLNLRVCTNSNNQGNARLRRDTTTGFRGVHKAIRRNQERYVAQIYVNNKHIYLGAFNTAREAAIRYNQAALEHFGSFSYQNKVG